MKPQPVPFRSLLAALAVMAPLLGCGSPRTAPNDAGSDSGEDVGVCTLPAFVCGAACCAPPEVCYDGACCAPSCEGKDCGLDGCGGDCGGCGDEERCDAEGRCVCEDPADDAAFCDRNGIMCGEYSGVDLCGEPRTALCPDQCEGAPCVLETGACNVAEPDERLCSLAMEKNGIECGAGVVQDSTGAIRAYDCGLGLCSDPPGCDEATGLCAICEGESDAELCALRHKNCGSLVEMNRCDVAVGVRDCGFGMACPDSQICSLNVCSDPDAPPANDTCAGAEPLVFFNNRIYFTYDSRNARNDMQTTCGGATGVDVVYSITVPVLSDLKADLSNPAVVSLHSACDGASLVCQGVSATFSFEAVPPGDYFLWLDSLTGRGEFSLLATPVPPPVNDTCAAAEAALVPSASQGSLIGASSEAAPDACGLAGPDVYYRVVMPTYGGLAIDLASWTPGFVPKASLLTDCAGSPVQCGQHIGVNLLGENQVRWIRVFGEGGGVGNFYLTLRAVAPVDNDVCAKATPLLNMDGTIALTGQIAAANDDLPGGCAADGVDVVYTFEVPPGGERDLLVLATMNGPYGFGLRLQTSCGGTDLASDCAMTPLKNTALLAERGLQPGRYYVIFETYESYVHAQAFALSGALRVPGVPPANDLCAAASAPAYTLEATAATDFTEIRNGTTIDAENEVSAGCPSLDLSGADVFYRFTGEGYLHAFVRTNSVGYVPNLFLLDACGGSPVACGSTEYGTTVSIAMHVGPGEHWLGVGGSAGSEGPFELEFHLYPDVSNTACDSALPVTFSGTPLSARIASDNSFAPEPDDWVMVCHTLARRQLVWQLRVPSGPPLDLHAQVESFHSSAGKALILRKSCSLESTEQACAHVSLTSALTLDVPYLATGDYFLIFVDNSGAGGPFTIALTLTPSTGLAANDTCGPTTAEALQFTGGVATATGSTSNAVDDETPALAPDTVGGDVYFQMNFAAPTDIAATVTPTSPRTLVPIVSLRSACGAPDLVSVIGEFIQPLELHARQVSGDLYLVVDSDGWDNEGAFTLEVVATPSP